MKSKQHILILTILLSLLQINIGCKEGIIPNVADIIGPDKVEAGTTEIYEIDPGPGTGFDFDWSIIPDNLAVAKNPDGSSTDIEFADVGVETDVVIQVVISADQFSPIIKSKGVTISPFPVLQVSEITGPVELDEFSTSTYSVDAHGDTGITYHWESDPASAGEFNAPEGRVTNFTVNEVTHDLSCTITVTVDSDNNEAILKTTDVTIKQTVGLAVGEILGPDLVDEIATVKYSVSAEGDTGILYRWSVDPEDAGTILNPTSPTTSFLASNIHEALPATIKLLVTSDHYGPIEKTLKITIIQKPLFGGAMGVGGYDIDKCNDMASDSSGNTYVVGEFSDWGYFGGDSGAKGSHGGTDIFVAKYKPDKNLDWVQNWGGDYDDAATAVYLDQERNIYITGYFRYTADFHPGGSQDIRTSFGYDDAFLSKFDNDGNFGWAHTWGGTGEDRALDIDRSGGYIYTAGSFEDAVDFNPGNDNEDIRYANGYKDAFLSSFTEDGLYADAWTWGGTYDDECTSVSVYNDYAFVAGYFRGEVDFDLGQQVEYHQSNGLEDVFLFSISYFPDWVYTWGGPGSDRATKVIFDNYDNNDGFLVTGTFQETVDFDPKDGVVERTATSPAFDDAFILRMGFVDNYLDLDWVQTWGGQYEDSASSVAINNQKIYVTGSFKSTMELNLPDGMTQFQSHGVDDTYLIGLAPDGSIRWAGTWGGLGIDRGLNVCTLSEPEVVFVAGFFSQVVDFDPGPDVTYLNALGMYDGYVSWFFPEVLD